MNSKIYKMNVSMNVRRDEWMNTRLMKRSINAGCQDKYMYFMMNKQMNAKMNILVSG